MEQNDSSGKFLYRVRGPPGGRYIVKLEKKEEYQSLSKMEVVETIPVAEEKPGHLGPR